LSIGEAVRATGTLRTMMRVREMKTRKKRRMQMPRQKRLHAA
jgi:hypothetical protein